VIVLRRGDEREHMRRRRREEWRTFSPQGRTPAASDGFASLSVFEEGRLPPRTSRRTPTRDEAEIITYVREGTLVYEDSRGASGLIHAGEFQRMTAGKGVRYGESNASPVEWAHVFQLWLRPAAPGLEAGHEQKRFSSAMRGGALCVVASPDGRRGSLRLHQDALLYSAVLEPGTHVVHELAAGRCAWLHVVKGALRCGTSTLGTGDGAGIRDERAVSLTAIEGTEVLLLDLADEARD
jgi:redox-sensitive bicupin YhaK (pirin superfamily)